MNMSIIVCELFEQQCDCFSLCWVVGQKGECCEFEVGNIVLCWFLLVGYFNVIYFNKVQIFGIEELFWLDLLDLCQCWEIIEWIMQLYLLVLVIICNQFCLEDLCVVVDELQILLWVLFKCGYELFNYLFYYLVCMLVLWVILYGVFMEIYFIGVLIIGEVGLGKSELVLELFSCGYWLVVDDVFEFIQIVLDVFDGICLELLQDLLEVCGLGVLNVWEMFGDIVVKKNKYFWLIVYLIKLMIELIFYGYECFIGDLGICYVLDLDVLLIILLVMFGCNLVVLIEVVIWLYILCIKGIDFVVMFIVCYSNMLECCIL